MIYICYGITKSASTFLYQLTEELFSAAGYTVCRIRRPKRGDRENYYDQITAPLIDKIERRAKGRAVVLKTHGRLDPAVARYIEDGRVKACATYRDPREIAMSMADNGARSRELGILPFSEIVKPEDALPSIDLQIAYLAEWLAVPGVETFSYNEVCFSTCNALRRIRDQIGVTVDDDISTIPFRNRMLIGQFNVGKPLRYRDMDEATQAVFLERYQSFYSTIDLDEGLIEAVDLSGAHPRGARIHRLEATLRLLRRLVKTKSLGTIVP